MTDTLALENLYSRVVAQFTADGTNVPNTFGWRERARHDVMQRIAWVPGNEPADGDAGKHAAPKYPGQNPRSLATLGEIFTVYVQGYDATNAESEFAQYKATRLLYDAWFRAVYLNAYGTFTIESLKWDRSKTERQHGAMLVAVCTIQAKIPDTAYGVAPVDTHALLTAQVLSQFDPAFEVDPK